MTGGSSTSVAWNGGASRAVVARVLDPCAIRLTAACEVRERIRGGVWIEPEVVAEVDLQRADARAAEGFTPRRGV